MGKKIRTETSLSRYHRLMDNLFTPVIQKSRGIVSGAITDVAITILADNAVLPFTMSVNAGDATAAGIAVSNKTPMARFPSKFLITKKKKRGTTIIFIKTINMISL